MKSLIIGFVGIILGAFAPIAHADEMSDRFLAACVAAGDNPAACTCASNAMKSTFSEQQFAQIVAALEGGGMDSAAMVLEALLSAEPSLVEGFILASNACN